MNIKIIAIDLDGTLLHDDKSMSEYTVSILEKCKQKGILVAIATARSESASQRYIDEINPEIVISNSGSLVRYKGDTIYKCTFSAQVSDSIIAELVRQKEFITISVESETGYYASWDSDQTDDYGHAIHHDFSAPLSEETYKISVELESEDGARAVADRYPDTKMAAFYGEKWYQFIHKDSGKMGGVKRISEFLKVELSQVASFGDDNVDIEMIRDCGIGVAMGNANDRVKVVADFICETNENDGVAKWLEKFVL